MAHASLSDHRSDWNQLMFALLQTIYYSDETQEVSHDLMTVLEDEGGSPFSAHVHQRETQSFPDRQ